MTRSLLVIIVLASLILTAFLVVGCGPKPAATSPVAGSATPPPAAPAPSPAASQVAAVYTCPMHPEVQQSAPGKCPKCGMDLVKKK